MNKSGHGVVYIVVAAMLWGFFPMFARILYAGGITVIQVVSARAMIAGAIFLVWGFFTGVYKGLRVKDYLFLTFYGCFSILGTYIFYSLSIKYLSSAMAAMLLYTAPAFVILFERLIYNEKITGVKMLALAAVFTGSALVVRIYDFTSMVLDIRGIIFGILSGIFYSMLTVIGRSAIKRGYTSLQNTFIPAVAVGVIFCAAVPPWTIPVPSTKIALCYLAVGVIGSVLPYFFYIKGLSTGIDGAVASILANIEPVTATICGVVIFSDRLEIPQVIGVMIVLLGAAIPSAASKLIPRLKTPPAQKSTSGTEK